jgi:hypothetical protein
MVESGVCGCEVERDVTHLGTTANASHTRCINVEKIKSVTYLQHLTISLVVV